MTTSKVKRCCKKKTPHWLGMYKFRSSLYGCNNMHSPASTPSQSASRFTVFLNHQRVGERLAGRTTVVIGSRWHDWSKAWVCVDGSSAGGELGTRSCNTRYSQLAGCCSPHFSAADCLLSCTSEHQSDHQSRHSMIASQGCKGRQYCPALSVCRPACCTAQPPAQMLFWPGIYQLAMLRRGRLQRFQTHVTHLRRQQGVTKSHAVHAVFHEESASLMNVQSIMCPTATHAIFRLHLCGRRLGSVGCAGMIYVTPPWMYWSILKHAF